MLRVKLLGGLELRLGDMRIAPLASARAESLLAYLLLHRDRAQPRQRLAFLLWPDSTESQARTNLRQVLHHLRRAWPDTDRFIEVGPRTLQWRPDAPLWLDVDVFQQAVAAGRLADAVETYTGDLLDGCYDEWVLEERERLAQLYVDALERLVRRLAEQGRRAEAITYAERLIGADPLREEAYRLLIRLCDAVGDRAAALRAYHACAAMLERELGVEPSAGTRAAYEALFPGAGEPQRRRRGPAASTRPPLVGRATERARLAALWRAAASGRAQLALVTGEPGIGKTRLVEELQSWCAHGGAVTAEARAYPAEGAMAYGLLVAWLRSEPIAARLRRVDRAQLRELARLLPELRAEIPDLARPEPLPEEEQRGRLFAAAASAIRSVGAPLLLVADDVQWCDVQTLQFVHYLLRGEPPARLLVAATARREDLDPRHPVNQLVAGLTTLGRCVEIGLDRFSREETGMLAAKLAGNPLTQADVDHLHAESEGNPLFIVEALRAGADTVGSRNAAGGSRVQAVIASRLAQLSEPAAELVGVAATIGREFTAQVLADSSGVDEPSFVRGLDELWRRGVVRAHGPSAYDFSHGKIREAAYRALSPAQRYHHHLRVARTLERSHVANLDAVAGQIAAHYDRAGAAHVAVAWYERAAEAAQRLHANADAVRFLERALEVTSELDAGAERAAVQLRLLTALPAPLVAVEGYLSPRVAAVHTRALHLARELGAEPEPPLVRSLALACLTRSEFEAARRFGEQLRARAERDGDDVLWVESAYVLGVAAFWEGRLEAARTLFAAAVARCRPEHRAAHLLRYGQDPEVFCGLRLAYTLWLLGRDDEARRARDAALALAEQSGHPFTHVSTMVWAALLALDQEDEERLRGLLRALTAGDRPRGTTLTLPFIDALAGYVEVLDGRAEDGIRRVRRALDEAGAGGPNAPGHLAMHMRILLAACAKGDDPRAGLAAVDEALAMGVAAQLWEAEIRRLRAEFLAALDAPPDEVEAELRRALAVARRQGARALEVRVEDSLHRLHAVPSARTL